ncbi:MAG: hypothetical protein HGA44_06865 [Cellulomonadaceae bacterium]|nr:hypothetical protein [Cellulomonadaceae bacterium]
MTSEAEKQLEHLATSGQDWSLPGVSALRSGFTVLDKALEALAADPSMAGSTATAADASLAVLRSDLTRSVGLLETMQTRLDEANAARESAKAALDRLPSGGLPSWFSTAVRAAEAGTVMQTGGVSVVVGETSLSAVDGYLSYRRAHAAASELAPIASSITQAGEEVKSTADLLLDVYGQDGGTGGGTTLPPIGGGGGGIGAGRGGVGSIAGYVSGTPVGTVGGIPTPTSPIPTSSTPVDLTPVTSTPVGPGPVTSTPVDPPMTYDDWLATQGPGSDLHVDSGMGGATSGAGGVGSGGYGSGGSGAGHLSLGTSGSTGSGWAGGVSSAAALAAGSRLTGVSGGGAAGAFGAGSGWSTASGAGQAGSAAMSGRGLAGGQAASAGSAGSATSAAGESAAAGGTRGGSGSTGMMGGGGGSGSRDDKRSRRGLGGPIALQLDDEDEAGPLSEGAGPGSR